MENSPLLPAKISIPLTMNSPINLTLHLYLTLYLTLYPTQNLTTYPTMYLTCYLTIHLIFLHQTHCRMHCLMMMNQSPRERAPEERK